MLILRRPLRGASSRMIPERKRQHGPADPLDPPATIMTRWNGQAATTAPSDRRARQTTSTFLRPTMSPNRRGSGGDGADKRYAVSTRSHSPATCARNAGGRGAPERTNDCSRDHEVVATTTTVNVKG